ncbi:MAG: hypothetical protein KAU35_10330 [candidate division Zixibacteria bacterium]|nr:hypothetical protein [candidate division Zixibacteria bacterium]
MVITANLPRWMSRSCGALAIAGLVVLLPTLKLSASVLVSPTVVFVTDKNPTGRMTLMNLGDKDMEVNIHFSFGLPVSDSLGKVRVVFQDSAVTDPRSALDWIRAFPRTVIIAPGASQTVRIMARPPGGLPDGEYWARIMVRSQAVANKVPRAGRADEIVTHLNMIMQTAIMFKYRTGDLVSNLELVGATATLEDTTVTVMIDLENRGNVSYMGVLQCWLRDNQGNEVDFYRANIAVYRGMRRRVDLSGITTEDKLPFTVEFRISSEERTDVAATDMIVGNKISYSVAVE